jgi:hypothetical protein
MTQGITFILEADATFRTLVGLNKAGTKYKAYPVVTPINEEAPYAVVFMTGKNPFGQCKDASTTYEYSFDVYSYESNFESVVTLDNAVASALDGKSGLFNGVTFQEIRFTNSRDEPFAADYKLFSRVSSFTAIV